MRLSPMLTCLWPGLPALWYRGDWAGCCLAILFAAASNFLLIASWHWPLWFSPALIRGLWLVLGIVWLGGLIYSAIRWSAITSEIQLEPGKDSFADAQMEYLKGNWFESEAILHQLLAKNPRDVEAGLLLVSVLRQTRRFSQAIAWVDRLKLLESAARWRLELAAESRKIDAGIQAQVETSKQEAETAKQAALDKAAQEAESMADALYG